VAAKAARADSVVRAVAVKAARVVRADRVAQVATADSTMF